MGRSVGEMYSFWDLAWVIWNYHGNKKKRITTKLKAGLRHKLLQTGGPRGLLKLVLSKIHTFTGWWLALGNPEPVFSWTTQRNHTHKMTTLYNRRRPRQSTDMSRLIDRMWPLLPATLVLFCSVLLSLSRDIARSLSHRSIVPVPTENLGRARETEVEGITRTHKHTHEPPRGHKAKSATIRNH